jgi:Na+-transporting methylmalonyl-CoA/oxaloacetate decarboxylase gamma subunit
MPKPRVARESVLLALIGYGVALVLVLLAFAVVDGEGEEWLLKVAFYLAVATTGVVLAFLLRQRRG